MDLAAAVNAYVQLVPTLLPATSVLGIRLLDYTDNREPCDVEDQVDRLL
ncbi:MAG: hypothetical protein ACI841_004349 [Planctomycetota bacterium]|jgi:hypothetical protein